MGVLPDAPAAAPAAASTVAVPAAGAVDPVVAAADAARAGAAAPASGDAAAQVSEPAKPVVDNRLSAAQRQVQQQQREIVTQQQQLRQREREIDSRVAQQVATEVEKRLGTFKQDPIAALRQLGFDDATIAARLLNQGKTTPDELAAKALAASEKLQKELVDRDQRDAVARAEREFSDIVKDAAKYPDLCDEWSPGEALREARGIVERLRARGIDPNQYSYADLASHLNKMAKARAARRDTLKAERTKKAAPQGDTKADGNGSSGQGASTGQPATTTLGKALGARTTLSDKPGHLMNDAELAAAVESEVARTRAHLNGKSL